jgi:hypothetical protein
LTDRDRGAAVAAPKGGIADEARHAADEVLHVLLPLAEEIEEFRSTRPGIAANDCVHDCLLRSGCDRFQTDRTYPTSRGGADVHGPG